MARPNTTLTEELDRRLRRLVRVLPGVAEVERLYMSAAAPTGQTFADRALSVLGITASVGGAFDAIPATGPLLVVANHPTGMLDGLVLSSLIGRRRGDVRLLANRWLAHVRAMASELVLIDPWTRDPHVNLAGLREAMRWLRRGGALCVFPAGAVSHFRPSLLASADPPWHAGVARLARATSAAVLPCHISGGNSALFHLAGLVHPWLRTALLPRELLRHRGTQVVMQVGEPMRAALLNTWGDDEITARLRASVYALGDGARGHRRAAPALSPASSRAPGTARPTFNEGPSPRATTSCTAEGRCLARDAQREVAAIAGAQRLIETQEYDVFWFSATQAPGLMQEVGRSREEAFRAAGEGTGADVDLDRFDDGYVHLALWDRRHDALAGGYRMRRVSADLPPAALYTRTLFEFDDRLVRALSPGLELGRAFVLREHQKRHTPLMLLWSGIARYVAADPEIRHLFGAVSIGASYSAPARAFMAAWLKRHAVDRLRAPLVAARHPIELHDEALLQSIGAAAVDARTFGSRVEALDHERKGVPVLLRQYLKLDARVLDFSIDPGFSNVLDALVTIDLPAAPRALLRRYMGFRQADAYIAHHQVTALATA